MMRITVIGLLAVAALVTGCSTVPVTKQGASPVPHNRIYQASYVGAASNSKDGTLLFLRDAGFLRSACTDNISVDGIKIFDIRHNEEIAIHVPAGRHFLLLQSGLGNPCPNEAASHETVLQAGQTQTYRILTASSGDVKMTRVK